MEAQKTAFLKALGDADESCFAFRGFVDRNDRKSDAFSFEELFQAIPKRDVNRMWSLALKKALPLVQGHVFLPSPRDESVPQTLEEADAEFQRTMGALETLGGLAKMALAYIADATRGCPPKLQALVQCLHGSLLPLTVLGEGGEATQTCILRLCEKYWLEGRPAREAVAAQMVPVLLLRSLTASARDADVKRVLAAKDALRVIDWRDPLSAPTKGLLLRALASALYLRKPEGRRVLSCVFCLDAGVTPEAFDVLRSQLPYARPRLLEGLSELLSRAWAQLEGDGGDLRREFELQLTLLLEGAFLARGPKLFGAVRALLRPFHALPRSRAHSDLLAKMHGPLLFKHLGAGNAQVRAHAAQLLGDCFPIVPRDATQEAAGAAMQRQVQALLRCVADEQPSVRAAAASSAGRVLAFFWETVGADEASQVRGRGKGGEGGSEGARGGRAPALPGRLTLGIRPALSTNRAA